jgi:GNAT superfamily N-acetyltransferase
MDMLVPLYRLPIHAAEAIESMRVKHEVIIRAVYPFERSALRDFVEKHFTRSWADEAEMAFRHMPPSCLLAIHKNQIVGFAAYDSTFNGFFGPTGVDAAHRGKGIGTALLIASLEALKTMGYVYAVIGSVGPAEFYAKTVGATPIPDSTPGPYVHLLKKI